MLKPIYIEATDIPDAWHQCVFQILEHGFRYIIDKGSYKGTERLEFDWITVYIKYPQTRPLEPKLPTHYNIPDPVAPDYIESYVPYLMTPQKEPGEQYTYGSRIFDQINIWIEIFKSTPNTNQAVLQVARPQDCLLSDPPCLRHIDMRVKDGQLIFYPYFRSWDLWNGFPANLGGIVYLQEYMATEIGIAPGPFICSSKGLHLYKYVHKLAEVLRGK